MELQGDSKEWRTLEENNRRGHYTRTHKKEGSLFIDLWQQSLNGRSASRKVSTYTDYTDTENTRTFMP
jgi:hypothetical protein